MIEFRAASPVLTDNSYFQYADDGPWAHMIPVATAGGDVIDVVAYFPEQPRLWWLHKGTATILGEEDLSRASYYDQPILLVETPLDWLRKQSTACIVDWTCDPRFVLRLVHEVRCSTSRLKNRLSARVSECTEPNFVISVACDERNAA